MKFFVSFLAIFLHVSVAHSLNVDCTGDSRMLWREGFSAMLTTLLAPITRIELHPNPITYNTSLGWLAGKTQLFLIIHQVTYTCVFLWRSVSSLLLSRHASFLTLTKIKLQKKKKINTIFDCIWLTVSSTNNKWNVVCSTGIFKCNSCKGCNDCNICRVTEKKNCNSCSLCSEQGKIFFNSCNIGSAKKYFSALAKHISVNTVNYVVLLSIWMKEFEDMFEGFQKSLLFQFT